MIALTFATEPFEACAVRIELRRVRDRVGDQAADRVVGAGGAAGADAEEGRHLREGGAAGQGGRSEAEAEAADIAAGEGRRHEGLPWRAASARRRAVLYRDLPERPRRGADCASVRGEVKAESGGVQRLAPGEPPRSRLRRVW